MITYNDNVIMGSNVTDTLPQPTCGQTTVDLSWPWNRSTMMESFRSKCAIHASAATSTSGRPKQKKNQKSKKTKKTKQNRATMLSIFRAHCSVYIEVVKRPNSRGHMASNHRVLESRFAALAQRRSGVCIIDVVCALLCAFFFASFVACLVVRTACAH